jgi:hypothetical protein
MRSWRKAAVAAGIVGSTLAGGAIGAAVFNSVGATAQSSDTAAVIPPAGGFDPARGGFDPARGGHVGAGGAREELLTGDTAEKVKAAALAAVEGGTIQRVETDAEGSPYEAHMTKADGTPVTVKVDKDFKVTSVESDDHGRGGRPASTGSNA